MARTLVDEPPPSTQNPAGDRLTLDDVPAENRPTMDDIPAYVAPGERRGPSPTLVDPPEPAAGQPRRGAPLTLADGPPRANRTPAAAPLHVVPATPPPAPAAATGPAAPPASVPVILPAPSAAAPAALPAPPAPPLLASPAPGNPISPAPPPMAYPAGGPGGGLLAQLPAMPAARPAMNPFPPAQGLTPVAAGPHPMPAPEAIGVPPPVAAPVAFAPPAPFAAPAAPLSTPVLKEHMASPEPLHTAPDAQPPAEQAPAQQASSQQGPSPQPPAEQAPAQQAPSPQAGAPRVPAGGRTLVGVAPPPGPAGGSALQVSSSQDTAVRYSPPGQTSAPDPLSATLPVTPGVLRAAARDGQDGEPGPDAAPPGTSSPDAQGPGETPHPANTPAPTTPRKSRAAAVIAAMIAVIGVLAIVGVVVGYFAFFRYTPLAERHIPAGSNLALRADLRQTAIFAPVRKHLWPLLVDKPSRKTPGKTLADKVAEGTGINAAIDLREVILASVDSKSWVALVGGNLKPGTFVTGMQKVLEEEGYPGWRRSGELLVGPGGVAFGQAEDGTLVIGTEAEIVNAALPSSEEYKRVDLPADGALSFAITKEAWEEMARNTFAVDAGGSLRRVRHVKGTLSLGDEPAFDIDIEPKGGENADTLGKDVETLLAALRLGLVLVPDQMGEKTALSSAKVTAENEHVRIRGTWPLEGLDRACAKLAETAALLGTVAGL